MSRLLIVAHGQPSDPPTAARALADLARRVASHLPDWDVASATLAEPGALEAVAVGMPGLVFPMFMAGGWFTRVQIPQRLMQAGAAGWQVLEPFGCDPAVHELARKVVQEAGGGDVILAAHGSFKSPVPAAIAQAAARKIRVDRPSARVEAGFIDQAPQLSGLTGFGEDAICLPFFAMSGGHVTDDIPSALAAAGFRGRILPAVGVDDRVPALIAAAARAGQPVCAQSCRYAPGDHRQVTPKT